MLLAKGAADRGHRLADDEVVVVAERQSGCRWRPVGFDLQQGDVGERVEADDLRFQHVAVLEFDVNRLRSGRLRAPPDPSPPDVLGDDVGVGDDFSPLLVEHEAGALGATPRTASKTERIVTTPGAASSGRSGPH